MGLIGQVKGAKQKPEEVHYVKDPLNDQWVDVDYMAALAQGLEPRTVLNASSNLKLSMEDLQKLSVKRPNKYLRKDARYKMNSRS